MLRTLDEYRRQPKAPRTSAADIYPYLEQMRQEAVKADLLTGEATWDHFLTLIQGAIETTREQMVAFQRQLGDSDTFEHHEMIRLKTQALLCGERIKAWEVVMTLPKDIMERGEKAETLLGRLENVGQHNN